VTYDTKWTMVKFSPQSSLEASVDAVTYWRSQWKMQLLKHQPNVNLDVFIMAGSHCIIASQALATPPHHHRMQQEAEFQEVFSQSITGSFW
jgi:hypothetical protein